MSDDADIRLPGSLRLGDFLGYIVPGSLFLLSVYAFEGAALRLRDAALKNIPLHAPLHVAVKAVSSAAVGQAWITQTMVGLAILMMTYTLGHIIASFASMAIERTYVFKGYGYPYESQLNLPSGRDEEAREWLKTSQAFYRGVFLWLNVYALLRFGAWTISTDWAIPYRGLCRWSSYIVGLLCIACLIAKAVLGIGHSQARHQIAEGARRRDLRDSRFGRLVNRLLLNQAKPYDAIARLIAGVIGTRRLFNSEFQQRYSELFRAEFGMDAAKADTNNFWLSYAFILQNSKALTSRLLNWQTLYTFSRNLAAAFFGAFLYGWMWFRIHGHVFEAPGVFATRALVAIPLSFYAVAFLLVLRYYYLYRGYFTKFTFRSFVYLAGRKLGANPTPAEA